MAETTTTDPRGGPNRTPLLVLIGIIALLVIGGGYLLFTSQTDLENTRQAGTGIANEATAIVGTERANISALEVTGTEYAADLATGQTEIGLRREQLMTATAVFNAAEDLIATLEVEGTAAGDLLFTATAVFDDSQDTIATLEVEATTASEQLATATAVFNDSQDTIATLEVEATAASVQLATATARIGVVQEDLATAEAQATAQAREQATLERAATAQAREQGTLERDATAQAQAFATLEAQATAASRDGRDDGDNNNDQGGPPPPPPDLDSALALADEEIDAGIADAADEVTIAFPRLTLDLSDENNVSVRQWYPNEYGDFVMGATVVFRGDEAADDDECGLSFRDQDDNNFYTVRLNRNGDVRFLVRINGDWQSNQEGERTRLRGEPAELLLIGEGSRFTLLINGEEVGSWRDNRLENGRLGLVAATFAESDETGCEFTNGWVLDLDGR